MSFLAALVIFLLPAPRKVAKSKKLNKRRIEN